MRRREFIAGLGSAAAWPLAASAQQDGRVRRIGVLTPFDENDPRAKARISAFTQGLADLGWTDGRNVRMDVHWGAGSVDGCGCSLDLQPDVILAHGTPATAAFQRETRTVPIVFAPLSDPVGDGFVISRPRRPLPFIRSSGIRLHPQQVQVQNISLRPSMCSTAIRFAPRLYGRRGKRGHPNLGPPCRWCATKTFLLRPELTRQRIAPVTFPEIGQHLRECQYEGSILDQR